MTWPAPSDLTVSTFLVLHTGGSTSSSRGTSGGPYLSCTTAFTGSPFAAPRWRRSRWNPRIPATCRTGPGLSSVAVERAPLERDAGEAGRGQRRRVQVPGPDHGQQPGQLAA